MPFYSYRIQNCNAGVRVMAELDGEGEVVGIESVARPEISDIDESPLSQLENAMTGLDIKGSSVKCTLECPYRRKEG